MNERVPFLFEIGVEEVPHWMIQPALAEIERLFCAVLGENRLEAGDIRVDGTPRRLVLRAESLPERQEDREELVMGPPKSAGEGAATGFARKNGVGVEQLLTESTPKGEYFALRRAIAGRETREILGAALPQLIAKIPWPKAMYWTGKGGETFIRPVRWIVALLGDRVVEFEFAGVQSTTNSRGHRRLGADEIVFDYANYEERLEKNGVILSAGKRRKRILDGIKKLLKGAGYTLVADDALLTDLVYLTEFPTPILGSFDEKFLTLPSEVLTTVMRHHQRYFTLKRADGSMAPAFIAVMNTKADRLGYVKKGNERVLEARFNDARFFWEFDQQKTLAARVPDLANVTFQAKLGSYLEKSKRVRERVRVFAAMLGADVAAAERAADLAKTDLTTEMVKEFTDLQGVIGGLYAKAQGEPETVWKAIYDHYLPQSIDDPIPSTLEGRILSVSDKLDTLRSCFSIGMAPSGSKDPFALRRAAQGVVKTLVEGRMPVQMKTFHHEIVPFLNDRVRYYFRDVRKFAYDEVNAVMAVEPPTLADLEDRLFAIQMVRETENFEPLAASFKRIRNILRQAEWQSGEVNPSLLEPGAEQELHDEVMRVRGEVEQCLKSHDYIKALQFMATLRPAVDRFFDAVLVNAQDAAVRANRLALLGGLLNAFSSIADFSEIVTSSTSEGTHQSA